MRLFYLFLKIILLVKKLKNLSKKFNSKKILISLKAAEQDRYNSSYFKNYYHCHFIMIKIDKN